MAATFFFFFFLSIFFGKRLNESTLLVLAHLQDPQMFGLRNSNDIGMRKSYELTPDGSPSKLLNGNGSTSGSSSRLDNSVIFGGQTQENKPAHRSIFRTSSLPEVASVGTREPELGSGTDPVGTRYDRFSFLLNSSSSSLPGEDDGKARMSRALGASITSPPSSSPTSILSPTNILSPTGIRSPTSSIDLQHRSSFATSDLALGAGLGFGLGIGVGKVSSPILHKEANGGSSHTGLFNSVSVGSPTKEPDPEKNLILKYRAFPDAYVSIALTCFCIFPRLDCTELKKPQ